MSGIKKLAGQTAIYGLPSILGRFLNYLLVPLYTGQFVPAEYGVINDVYAVVAFIAVLLPWGMETAFFRFSNKKEYNPRQVLQTTMLLVLFSGAIFIAVILGFTNTLANLLLYPDHPEYVIWMGLALGFDALSVIPLAKLRNENRPVKFAGITLSSIVINIALNIFFIGYCMPAFQRGESNFFIDTFYNNSIGVGYVFIANMLASGAKLLLLLPAYRLLKFRISKPLLREILWYATPLVVVGFAGIINETLDRRLIRILLEPRLGTTEALAQVGIYGAVYKLAIIITLFVQAFRYAAEPFFFAREKETDSRQVYADVMKWFTIVAALIFLVVMEYLDIFKYFIRTEAYWTGLYIVPILLLANIFLGWIYNLSVWYKMTHKTLLGAGVAIFGAIITIAMNIYLIPKIGYEGAAWTTFTAYGSMVVVSYVLSQRYFPIPYEVGRILGYLLLAVGLWYAGNLLHIENTLFKYLWKTAVIVLYLAIVAYFERDSVAKLRSK